MRHILATIATLLPSAAMAQTQSISLSLTEALQIATGKSEQVDIAQAGVRRALAQRAGARAQFLPQLTSFLGYSRTLATEFSGLFDPPERVDCPGLTVMPGAPVVERVAELERFLLCGGPSASLFPGGGGGASLPFGRTNVWNGGLSFSQPVYAGGRLRAQLESARAGLDLAQIEVNASNAQFVLNVTQAFYDTALARLLLEIAQANLAEAERTLEFVRLGYKVGRLPEFDVLRAEVTRRNQLPEIARRRAAITQSLIRLRQLLEIPISTEVALVDDLASADLPVPEAFEAQVRAATEPLLRVTERAPVRQAAALVRQRQAAADIARSQRRPNISIGSDYGLVAYPRGFLPTSTNQFRNNWTAGFNVTLPLFTGGRIRAEIEAAEASVVEARAQRDLTEELALLDTAVALDQLQTALQEWEAAKGTVEQAARAFEIARLRYNQGISNLIELDDARVALLEARANRARAARDVQVMRGTVALLPFLPLNTAPQLPGQPIPAVRGQGLQQQTPPASLFGNTQSGIGNPTVQGTTGERGTSGAGGRRF